MKKLYIIIVGLIMLTLTLEGIDIYLSNSLSTQSLSASKYRTRIDELDEQNIALKAQLLRLTSYDVISSSAASIGFIQPKNVLSVKSQPHLAVSR